MTRTTGRKLKSSGADSQHQKAKLSKIRKAISRFITRTENIVRSISPDVRIMIPKLLSQHRLKSQRKQNVPRTRDSLQTRQHETKLQVQKPSVISTPQFKGICELEISLADIPRETDSEQEDTDDERYEEYHCIREKIENLLATRLEVRKAKSRSHTQRDSLSLQRSLDTLASFLSPSVLNEYLLEGVDSLAWPERSLQQGLVVKF